MCYSAESARSLLNPKCPWTVIRWCTLLSMDKYTGENWVGKLLVILRVTLVSCQAPGAGIHDYYSDFFHVN